MGIALKRMTAVLLLIMMIIIPVSDVYAEPQAGQTAEMGHAAQETELSDFEKQKQASYETVPETIILPGGLKDRKSMGIRP